ncbi:MAG: alpha-galactosidase [Armatimonadetes bacterium]|nr:alpha-galactosidase [Armatimonadota bacterium]
MPSYQLGSDVLLLTVDQESQGLHIHSPVWEGLHIGPVISALRVDGTEVHPESMQVEGGTEGGSDCLVLHSSCQPVPVSMVQRFTIAEHGGLLLQIELRNDSGRQVCLNHVALLRSEASQQGATRFGLSPKRVRIFDQGRHWARVRGLTEAAGSKSSEGEADALLPVRGASELCWVAYDSDSRNALLVGFTTSERWLGHVAIECSPDGTVTEWSVEFDGGDVLLQPGEGVALEEVLFLAGEDPYCLLEQYADIVKVKHGVELPPTPVTWCSWYPYRLGVTDERVLANARIAKERLQPLGFSTLLVDLGWEEEWLPCVFKENDQFPQGFAGLSEKLRELGLQLGAWSAPCTISALDPLSRDHPEWLLGSAEEKPLTRGQWFWEPHGDIYCLDTTHPGAQEWLRQNIRSLAERGIRYLKPDFFGGVLDGALRERHDKSIVAGGGCEAARIGMKILLEEMRAADPEALVLNCGGPDLPGSHQFPLLYTCADTGNTGYVGWKHLREDYGKNVAGHLFKQGRWGVLQPSCLCVGLPGTLEEARLRATATFLTGGQVDISDDLTTLPEDRWEVLLATLPPLSLPARPVDLFEPVGVISTAYEAMCRGEDKEGQELPTREESCVWHLPVSGGWDQWDLVALFNYEESPRDGGGACQITRFVVPFDRLHLDPETPYWIYEFWSGQFIGTIPGGADNPRGYVHPGDTQRLLATQSKGVLDVSFFGPGIKLLVIRPARPHPWVLGTSFHQSGGVELRDVAWDDQRNALRGTLCRPSGQRGYISVADSGREIARAEVNGRSVTPRRGSNGAVFLPVITEEDHTEWEVGWA